MRRLKGRTALITGAASGIGRATALALVKEGMRLVVCDLDEAGLASLADEVGPDAVALSQRVEVSDRAAMQAFAAAVREADIPVDVLINNAGIGAGGNFLDIPLADWDRLIGVNVWGVIYGCHFFLPEMVTRGRGGHVVNLSSLLGFQPMMGATSYVSSKFAVLGFSLSLREELREHGIGVSVICPGIVNTQIIERTRFHGVEDEAATRGKVVDMYERRNYPPEKVARAIVKAIRRNKAQLPVSPEAWLFLYLRRFTPWLARLVGNRLARQAE